MWPALVRPQQLTFNLMNSATNMDKSKLQAICGTHSFYISLQDHGTAVQSFRRELSKKHTTRLHLAVLNDQHLAAIQISMVPFELDYIPKQTYFQCSVRYTWCCEAAHEISNLSEVGRAIQPLYDSYYSTGWDFSKTD